MTAHPKPKRAKRKKGPTPAEKEAIRREVFERDGYRCQHHWFTGDPLGEGISHWCCKPITWDSGHLHHVRPRSLGGDWSAGNLLTVCASCHDRIHRMGEK